MKKSFRGNYKEPLSSWQARGLPAFKNSVLVTVVGVLMALSWLARPFPAGGADSVTEKTEDARKSINLEALSRLKGIDLESNAAVKAAILRVLDQVRGTPQFVEIVCDFNVKGQSAGLLEAMQKDPSGPSGAEAGRLLLRGDDTGTLKGAIKDTNAESVVEALGNTGEKASVPLLLPIVTETSRPLQVRKKAVEALAKTREGASALLDLARAKTLPEDLKPAASQELSNVRWDNLKTDAALLLPPSANQEAHALVAIPELVSRKGDPLKGAAVFRRETVGCFKCHQINGEGVDFGPNLSEIGTKLAKDALYVSIRDPSAGISFGYEAWLLDFKNGDDALGLVVSETKDELALKAVGGLVTRYKKSEIARRTKQKLSIMPAGLEQTMSTDDLVDLVEYLSSLKKRPQ
jgi:putative heme-binding domain-containing protein